MSGSLARRFQSWGSVAAVAALIPLSAPLSAQGAQIAARHLEGTLHGYLAMRNESGQVIAAGDLIQVVRGSQVRAHVIFHFKDGSLDDESTVFTQRGTFHLISDHHVQTGPFFSHSIDMWVDVPKGEVKVRSSGKDGKDETHTEKMKLPPDVLSPPMLITIAKNLSAAGAQVSMVVASPKPRLVKLLFSDQGEDKFSVAGSERRARHYRAKFDLQGIAGVVAPLVGKQPADIEIWVEPGEVPAFVKEEGQLSEGGPIVSIQQTGPIWPDSTHPESGK